VLTAAELELDGLPRCALSTQSSPSMELSGSFDTNNKGTADPYP
jgi:hypothetical protein